MEDELIEKLISSLDFNSEVKFLLEEEIKREYGEDLYKDINKEFQDNWSYELSERIESIDINALVKDAVKKAIIAKNKI
tara:strand:- start:302 stop:538 length:237 start_codon:yes stop_codon:yes gene_type:complete